MTLSPKKFKSLDAGLALLFAKMSLKLNYHVTELPKNMTNNSNRVRLRMKIFKELKTMTTVLKTKA